MGLLELAPSPEQNSKHRAPSNSDHFISGAQNTTGKHGFSNDLPNAIIKPPDTVRGPRLRAVERRRNQR
eukprot:12210971-Alexandrium_andersonii.AAC.1